MKIIFFGSSDFAVPSLKKILDCNYEILAVVTQPDRQKGRHLKVESTAVKKLASKYNLSIYQPWDLKDLKFIDNIERLNADIFVVISYGHILTQQVLSIPKKFAINVHASLLPKYRGAAPIEWAIINGEEKTGVSIIKMNEYMDRGEIILQKEIPINTRDTAITLNEKLSKLGADSLIETFNLIEKDQLSFRSQDDSQVSYAPKLKKNNGLIDWKKSALSIYNQIRALVPWPGSFSYYQGKLLKIWSAQVAFQEESQIAEPGTIVKASKEDIIVATGKDNLAITELQLESSKQMKVSQFISGHRVKIGDKLG